MNLLKHSHEYPLKKDYKTLGEVGGDSKYCFLPKDRSYLACVTREFPNPADDGNSTMIEGVILSCGDAKHLPLKWNLDYQKGVWISETFSTIKEGATTSSSFYTDEIVTFEAGIKEAFSGFLNPPVITISLEC